MVLISSSLALLAVSAGLTAAHQPGHEALHKRASSPDNTCGPKNGFTCDPNSENGGPCCSASGYCGSGDAYCGDGCQAGFGTCGNSGSSTSPSPSSNPGSSPSGTAPSSGSCSSVDGLGSFANHVVYDFSSAQSLPSGLHSVPETDPAGTAPYSRTYDASLTTVSGGYANLLVPGGQKSSPIKGASIQTVEEDIKFGSIRTTAILTGEKGVCNGFFYYSANAQEIDTEFLSDPTSQSNPGDGSTPLHLTNHDADKSKDLTTVAVPSDATTKAHEYRTDWTAGVTSFYIDGKKVWSTTKDVPSDSGPWIWNNWANGDIQWSVGPPANDAVLKISKIEMYYNTSTSKC